MCKVNIRTKLCSKFELRFVANRGSDAQFVETFKRCVHALYVLKRCLETISDESYACSIIQVKGNKASNMTSIKRHLFTNFSLQRQHSKLNVPIASLSEANIDLKPQEMVPPDNHNDLHFNRVSFINDICRCLEMCSDYIQSLNALCSNGTILAQSLIQVFSQDLNRLSAESPLDNMTHHFAVIERFLSAWEAISVATAGASATVKTDTLMSLQDVINQLENSSRNDRNSPSEDAQKSFGECMKSAKKCLLSYIELQAQFSYTSWLTLTSLSQTLNADQSLTDNLKEIKRHFQLGNFNCLIQPPIPQPRHTPINKISPPASKLSPASPIAVSKYSLDSSNCTSDDSDSYGLEDAINLLSLRPVTQKSKLKDDVIVCRNDQQLQVTNYDLDFEKLDNFLKPSTWPGRRANDENCRNLQVWPQAAMSEINNPFLNTFQAWNNLVALDNVSNQSNSDDSISLETDSSANVNAYVDSLIELQEQKQMAAKRLSCSSDAINQDQGFFYSGPSIDLLGSTNSTPFDVRTAKTSTWPLKQVTSGNISPFFGRVFEDDLLSSPLTPQTINPGNSVLWPFMNSKPG